ncbi:MAG: HU family DNA-binding protein [Wenzhouxiangellaceae bacterium]
MTDTSQIVNTMKDKVDGLTLEQALEAFNAVLDTIAASLVRGEKVQIAGFGLFSILERAEREGRDPKTGETIMIPASKDVRFKANKRLKDAING